MKKLFLLILISVIISYLISIKIFWGGYTYLIIPLIVGSLIVFIQKKIRVMNLLKKLILGSLLFGFLTMLLINGIFYFRESFFNISSFLIYSSIFSIVSFLGGLIGIIIKEFYYQHENK